MADGPRQTDLSQRAAMIASGGGTSASAGRFRDRASAVFERWREAWFGPGVPIAPVAPADTRPRATDYQYAQNLRWTPRDGEPIGFAQLRQVADSVDLVRMCIETRKDQIEKLTWSIVASDPDDDLEGDPRIEVLTRFLRWPDRRLHWKQWIRSMLEEMLVTDATSIYVRRMKLSGIPYALELIDGATIKPMIDEAGRIPIEGPAYAQVIKGLPAVEFTAKELLYKPRNIRTHKVYGMSPVEQMLGIIAILANKTESQIAYYTQGNIPDAFIGVPDNWSPAQVREWQDLWDALMEGDLAQRRKARFIPGQIAKNFVQTREPDLKNDFDEYLARLVCFAFSLPPTAFVKQMNRAVAETVQDVALQEGLLPLLEWVKMVMDEIIQMHFGFADLAFQWQDVKSPDPLAKAQENKLLVEMGVKSVDEWAVELGLVPPGLPNAVWTTAGPKLIKDILNPPEPPAFAGPGGAPPPKQIGAGNSPQSRDGGGKGDREVVVGEVVGKVIPAQYLDMAERAKDVMSKLAERPAIGFLADLEKREWNESEVVRAKTTPESTPGSFAPKGTTWELQQPLPELPIRGDAARFREWLADTHPGGFTEFYKDILTKNGVTPRDAPAFTTVQSAPKTEDEFAAMLRDDSLPGLKQSFLQLPQEEREVGMLRTLQLAAMEKEIGFTPEAIARWATITIAWNGDWDTPAGRALRACYAHVYGGEVYDGDGDRLTAREVDALWKQSAQGIGETQLENLVRCEAAFQRERLQGALKAGLRVPDAGVPSRPMTPEFDAEGVTVYRGVVLDKDEVAAGGLDALRRETDFLLGATSATSMAPNAAERFARGWSLAVARLKAAGKDVSNHAKVMPALRKGEVGVVVKLTVPWRRVVGSFVGGYGSLYVSEVLVAGDRAALKGKAVGLYRGPLRKPVSTSIPWEAI